MKYPHLPIIDAVISWSADKRYKGTILKSSNFQGVEKSGGNSHGDVKRKDSGNQIHDKEHRNVKIRFLYRLDKPIDWKYLVGELEMEKLINEVPLCKHHKKKKLKPNEFWSPNPFEMYKKSDDLNSKEEKVKVNPTSS